MNRHLGARRHPTPHKTRISDNGNPGCIVLQAWKKVGGILTKTTSCVIQRIQPLVNDIPRWPVLVAAKGFPIDNHQS
ncbi:MAG: hypothetical protein J5529_12480 [Prevotella sp.]|nr:hypothetical protein [Prevotella sp.]